MPIRDNRYIPEEDRDFFILLRAGLWQKAEEPLSDSPDWEYIYTIACEQTVQGIVADGITILKAAYGQGRFDTPFPTGEHWQETYDKFLSAVAQIVRRNWLVDQEQTKICDILNRSGIRYCIIKGQVVARCYPKPMLRCSGDIDILFDKDMRLAVDVLTPLATNVNGHLNDVDSHYDMYFRGVPPDPQAVEVELHEVARSYFADKLDQVTEAERELMFTGSNFTHYQHNGIMIQTPSLTYHTLFLLSHILRHVMNTGIGLRQFCDWAVFLSRNREELNREIITYMIYHAGFQRQWNIFRTFISDFLGLSPELDPNLKQRDIRSSNHILWEQCKEMGNFGHNRTEKEYNSDCFVSRNWYYAMSANALFMRTFRIAPRNAIQRLINFYTTQARAIIRRTSNF